MSITTGTGDRGTARLYSGEEVPKHDPRLEALGEVDELVVALGLARAHGLQAETEGLVRRLQRVLFVVGAEIATVPEGTDRLRQRIDEAAVRDLDALRERLEAQVSCPEGFVLPGGSPGAAHLDQARCAARCCERRVTALAEGGAVRNPALLAWLNRLSDVLWLLARSEEEEITPLRNAEHGMPNADCRLPNAE